MKKLTNGTIMLNKEDLLDMKRGNSISVSVSGVTQVEIMIIKEEVKC